MAEERIIPLSRLTDRSSKASDMDSVAAAKRKAGDQRAFDVLMQAQNTYFGMYQFQKDWQRNKNYNYGKQWDDVICVNGKMMTEEEYILQQGSVPLKNNLIRRLVRNVLGVYRSQSKEPTCVARDRDEQRLGETMSTILQCNMQRNEMDELYSRTFEKYLIGGLAVHYKWYGWMNGTKDCWTEAIGNDQIFIDNDARDPRMWDLKIIGHIRDMDFLAMASKFAKTKEDYERLSRIYAAAKDTQYVKSFFEQFGQVRLQRLDFLTPKDPSKCRVIEVWRKEIRPRYHCHDPLKADYFLTDDEHFAEDVTAVNVRRLQQCVLQGIPTSEAPLITYEWRLEDYWYYYILSPFGDIIDEGETPYEHGEHPYVVKAYPFIDGEIHSFVSDVIDQQRYVNRLITMYDWIMRSSAKGVLIFPEECLSDEMSLDEIMENWSRFDGVIIAKTKDGVKLPEQIANNATNIGIGELLNLQLKFFEDISGVQGALQGKPGFSGESGEHANAMIQNATTSLLDLLDSFSNFVKKAAYKDVKNMQQFYDSKRVFNIAGKNAIVEYDPETMGDVEMNISIVESTSTPVYRQMQNQFLKEIWASGQISLEQMLENGSFDFADQLLQSIKSQKEQLEQGQTPDGLSPELQQQAQQGVNMGNVNRAYDMLRNPFRYRAAA